MQIVDYLFDYVDQRVKSGDDRFGMSIEEWMLSNWSAYEVIRNRLYPLTRDSGSADEATRLLVHEAMFPHKAELPEPGGLLFVDSRYTDLMSKMASHYSVTHLYGFFPTGDHQLTTGIKDVNLTKWWHDLYGIIREPSVTRAYLLQLLIDEVTVFLKRLSPKAIVLTYDNLHTERTIAIAARSLNIPLITIQHGFFSRVGRPEILDGGATDYLLVWGEQTRRYYVSKDILPESRVKVFGYPYHLCMDDLVGTPPEAGQSPVCFVGQNWESWNTEFGQRKERIVRDFIEACSRLGIPYRYRPHPNESREVVERLLPAENITPPGQSVCNAIESFSAFVSINSTMLLEVALGGSVSLQINDPAFGFDDFQQIGACHSCEDNLEAIEESLKKIWTGELKAFPVNPECIKVPYDLEGDFLKILDEILSDFNSASSPATQIRTSPLVCVLGAEDQINANVSKELGDMLARSSHGEYASCISCQSESYGPSAGIMAAFGDTIASELTIPTDLDIGELNDHLGRDAGDGKSSRAALGSLVLDARDTAFTLPYWRSRFADVSSVIVISDPREMAKRRRLDSGCDETVCALQWMETLAAALTNSKGIRTSFVFPDSPHAERDQPEPNADSIQLTANLLYQYCEASLRPLDGMSTSSGKAPDSAVGEAALIFRQHYRSALETLSANSFHNIEIPWLWRKCFALEMDKALLETDKALLEAEISRVNAEIVWAKQTIADLCTEVSNLSGEVYRLSVESSTLRHDIAAIHNSRSWRMLEFARRLGALARRVLRKG